MNERDRSDPGRPPSGARTLVDVAREAGVGLATTSRALSGHPSVAAGTRQRVLEAAERLGYRPNLVARAFSQQRTHTLEAIVPLVTHYLYVEVLRGVEVALTDTDYSLVIRTVERQDDRERAFAACCLPGRADGALVVSMAPPDDFVERLAAAGLPAALVDAAHPRLPAVVVDHTAAAGAAVRFCRELGHRRIALIDRAQDPFAPIFPGPRQRGYRAALAEAGLPAPPEYEQVAEFSPDGGATSLDALLALPNPPTAVLTGSDVQAMGALDAARRRGVRVPDDLSVVGYNDVELTQYLGLTTVHVPMRELGRRGGELLLAALAQPEQPLQRNELPTELIVRRTTAPPRSAV